MVIPCTLRPIRKHSFNSDMSAPHKLGRYLHSVFNIEGFGHSRWVVGCYIDIDHSTYTQEMSPTAFVEACVEYLNQPPERKKFERSHKASLYGALEIYSYKLKQNGKGPFVELLLITDEQKNENFWGEGISFDHGRRRKRSS